ncbi:retron Ec48 family effector membrane protein (plasmid) [Chromobacterium amazonense]|uniref:retron Ec48 family effector membrane protein n=1 Tax=Chromobacterium amazonense TaxID=1382803 RepID=UPI00237E5436|nr:retron Ec48 family effector membrane protein [Chromobacterium amazonense]MDE1712020.1 retron Ec48 family effector membrane protein [Chromobacterium amazonense]
MKIKKILPRPGNDFAIYPKIIFYYILFSAIVSIASLIAVHFAKNGLHVDSYKDITTAISKKSRAEIFFSTFKYLIDIMAAIATGLGITVALKSYAISSKTSKLSNHIENLTLFNDYILRELKKFDRISPISIDSIFWYNTLFPNSKNGDLHCAGSRYIEIMENICLTITQSNEHYSKNAKSFSILNHQNSMLNILQNIGIKFEKLSRVDYLDAEAQLINLINKVNFSFCPEDFKSKIGTNITYR